MRDHGFRRVVTNDVSACEVSVVKEHFIVVFVPEEVCLHNNRYLQVSGDTVPVDRFEFWFVDVVDLDLVLRELVSEHTRFNREWVVSDVGVVP